jgi:hypothetical protein
LRVLKELAQVNLARLRFPLDAPQSRGFVEAVDRINRLADAAAGFVWRYETGEVHPSLSGDPLTVINLSVWRSYADLHAFVYRSTHGHYVRRRDEWFDRIQTPATALWWVAPGHRPTPEQALARLKHLRTWGPTPQAFTVRTRFTASSERDENRRRRS